MKWTSFFYLVIFLFSSSSSSSEVIELSEDIKLQKINPTTWQHTSSKHLKNFGLVPANGLIKIINNEAIIVDTAWTNDQTDEILDWLSARGISPTLVIVTHSHNDRMGGIEAVHARNIPSIASNLTIQLARKNDLEEPKKGFIESHTISFNGERIELLHPGTGHSKDNIVVWFKEDKLLFGGCLIKSKSALSLGYFKRLYLNAWENTLIKLVSHYNEASVVIPGHGRSGTLELIRHTLKLTRSAQK